MSDYFEYKFDQAAKIGSHVYLVPTVGDACRLLKADAKVVDLGCGNGDVLAELKQPEWDAYGVDLSTEGITDGRQRHPEIKFKQMAFDDSLVAELGADSFDAAISTEVIEHLYAPREICRVAFALLKPGGLLVVSTPYHGYLKNVALALSGSFDKHFTALMDCGHIKFWSYQTLTALLAESGFRDFEFRGAGRLPWLWKSMVVSARKPA